jgi:hypothetical protein
MAVSHFTNLHFCVMYFNACLAERAAEMSNGIKAAALAREPAVYPPILRLFCLR